MATRSDPPLSPPRGSFSVWHRLLRGYGPLAVLAILLLLMAVLVPSKSPDATNVIGGAAASGDDETVEIDETTGDTVPVDGTAAGSGGSAGTEGSVKKGVPARTDPCPGQAEQVPGDPYSPPCIAFSGDNGGATSNGVTATEIKVAYRSLNEKGFQQTLAALAGATLQDGPEDIKRTVVALADYFNKRYQFYGRKLVVEFYNGQGSNTTELLGGGREKAEADADRVKSIGAFADLSATSEPYANALARRQIVAFGDPYLSRPWHEQRRPFTWSLATDGTMVATEAAEYAAKRLCNKSAKWAGGEFKDRPRVIATFAPENSWYQESVQIARGKMQELNCSPSTNVEYQLDLGTMSNQAANIIPKMKSAGVTTILCGCDPIMPVFLTGEMNRQSYFPEFVIVGTALTDHDIVGQLWNQEAAKHAFGVSSLTGFVPPTQTIAYEAYKTVRTDEPAFTVDLIYYQMQMLAIGVQMAGPNLTPQAFEAGMFRYPPKLGPVGYWVFGPGDYTPPNDVREIYWDPNATSTYNGKKGAYIDPSGGNVRWRVNQIPAGDPQIPVR